MLVITGKRIVQSDPSRPVLIPTYSAEDVLNIRTAFRLNQEQFAARLGYGDKAYVSKVEHGRLNPIPVNFCARLYVWLESNPTPVAYYEAEQEYVLIREVVGIINVRVCKKCGLTFRCTHPRRLYCGECRPYKRKK
jgi:ribosomal protein S27AE